MSSSEWPTTQLLPNPLAEAGESRLLAGIRQFMRMLERYAPGLPGPLQALAGGRLAGFLAGLCHRPAKGPGASYIFYPPPPEPPRLQFLVSSLTRRISAAGSASSPPTSRRGGPVAAHCQTLWSRLASNQLCVCDTGARSVGILDLVNKSMRRFAPSGTATWESPSTWRSIPMVPGTWLTQAGTKC